MAATQPCTIATTFNKGSSSVKNTLTASGVDVKWTKTDWLNTEIKLSDFDLLVLKNLVCAVTNDIDYESICTVMGDYLYQAVRPSLNLGKKKLLKDDDSIASGSTPCIEGTVNKTKNRKGGRKGGGANKAKGAKGPSKADQIRMQNSIGSLNSKVEGALSAFSGNDEFRCPKLFMEKIVEMRGIGFLCCVWFLLTKRKSLSWDQELTALSYSIIVSLERFIKVTEKLKGKSYLDSLKDEIVSVTLIKDLKDKLAELKDKFEFSGEKLYRTSPKLLIFSEFDTVLPVSTVKPYPHQAKICKILEDNIDNGCYVMYRAITNAGKTTTIAMLAATVQKIRNTRHEKDLSKLTIIFCCNIKSVTDTAGQWLQNTTHISSIPDLQFAIAFERPITRELMIRNSHMSRAIDDRLVIICSPHLAMRILRERGDTPFILFHDEPTIGAENRESCSLAQNVELMMYPPRWTIVSSATLPTEVELNPFLKKFKRLNPSGHIENVASAKINIGCDIYSHNGTSFLPHLGSTSTDELSRCLTNIKDNMFLSRSYTPLSVSELCNFATESEIPDIPKIGVHFSKIDNLSADAVRLFGLKILDHVSKTDDSTTKEICSKPIKCFGRSVEFSNLGTSSASKFSRMSLIASRDPLNFALEAFANLMEEINKTKVYSIEKLVSQYWKIQEQWSSEIEKIKKRKKKPPVSSKRRNSTGEADKEEKGDYEQQERDLLANKPFLSFPEYYQINTQRHAEKYSPNGKVDVERFPNRDFSFLTEKTVNAPGDVLLLLCCGVGIYAPEDNTVNSGGYLELVISLAKQGRLAYLVADHNIAYGVNFPFSRTIVCDDFTADHSMNTVFQLMSRAGRVGQSWFAESFVSDEVVRNLKEYSHSDKSPGGQVEIKNMISVAKEITLREREKQ